MSINMYSEFITLLSSFVFHFNRWYLYLRCFCTIGTASRRKSWLVNISLSISHFWLGYLRKMPSHLMYKGKWLAHFSTG